MYAMYPHSNFSNYHDCHRDKENINKSITSPSSFSIVLLLRLVQFFFVVL